MQQNDFFGDLLIAIQNRITEKCPEIRYCNLDIGQLEVYTMDSPSVSWPCLLIDFNESNYNDLHQLVEEGDSMITMRLGFAPFSQTSNLQPENVRRMGLAFFKLENKIYKTFKGWQPFNDDGTPMCQPFSRRRAITERREEDAFRVRALGFVTSFEDDTATGDQDTVEPEINFDFG